MKKTLIALSIMLIASTAESACNIKSLKGAYMAAGNYMGYTNGQPQSCGALARIVFDGEGNADLYEIETCGGVFLNNGAPIHENGKYMIDSLCAGAVAFDNASFAFIFDKSLKNGQIIGGNPSAGLSGSGTINKQ